MRQADPVHRDTLPRCVALIGPPGAGVSTLGTALARLRPQITWLDTSASSDLSGAACVAAADGIVIVMSAVQGLDAATGGLWEAASHLPTTIVVTHLDLARADLDESAAICRRILGTDVQIPYLPIHDDDEQLAGFLDVLGDVILVTQPDGIQVLDTDDEHRMLTEPYREDLVDLLLAESADDQTLMDVSGGAALPTGMLTAWLCEGIQAGRLHVALGTALGTPRGDIGMDLVAAMVDSTTATLNRHPLPVVTGPDGEPTDPLRTEGPGLALVIGRDNGMALCRILRGTLENGQDAIAATSSVTTACTIAWTDAQSAHAGQVVHMQADLPAGATLSDPSAPILIPFA